MSKRVFQMVRIVFRTKEVCMLCADDVLLMIQTSLWFCDILNIFVVVLILNFWLQISNFLLKTFIKHIKMWKTPKPPTNFFCQRIKMRKIPKLGIKFAKLWKKGAGVVVWRLSMAASSRLTYSPHLLSKPRLSPTSVANLHFPAAGSPLRFKSNIFSAEFFSLQTRRVPVPVVFSDRRRRRSIEPSNVYVSETFFSLY